MGYEAKALADGGRAPRQHGRGRAQSIFWVPPEARWSHLKARARQPTIGQLVIDAVASIERDNPVIYTMDPGWPSAKAVAVRDGKVLSVGSMDDLQPWLKGGEYEIVDTFEDKILMLGFIEPHGHPLIGSVLLIGSIEPGKFAASAVLEQDPYEVKPERLRDAPAWGPSLAGW